MKAKDIFKKLGFDCEEKELYQPNGGIYHKEIKYFIKGQTINDLYFGYMITFILDNDNKYISKHYAHSVNIVGCGGSNLVDIPLLKAINQQFIELGWLDSDDFDFDVNMIGDDE